MTGDRIQATHVGSLVRPPKLVEHPKKIEAGEAYDEAAYEACLTESVEELVQQQVDAGIDIVFDGECSKGKNWAFYIHDRMSGITRRPQAPEEAKDPLATPGGGHDHVAFPEFYEEYDKATGLARRLGFPVVIDGPLEYTGQKQVQHDIANIKAAAGKAGV